MGQEEVPGHVEAGGDGRAEQEGGGLEQGGAEAASINLRKNLDGTRKCWYVLAFCAWMPDRGCEENARRAY